MELLLVRIDHFRDRKEYLSVLRTWLSEICIDNGRVITVGDVHLLFIVADAAQNSSLLEHFKTKEIDRNSKGEVRYYVCRCCCSLFIIAVLTW